MTRSRSENFFAVPFDREPIIIICKLNSLSGICIIFKLVGPGGFEPLVFKSVVKLKTYGVNFGV